MEVAGQEGSSMLSPAVLVVCALNLLGRSASTAPIRFVATPPTGASIYAEAFVVHSPDAIYLVTSTAAFRDAQGSCAQGEHRDAARKIASIIVHEEWHLQHGADEKSAYLAQLTTLAALGASPNLMAAVRQSMAFVLRAEACGRDRSSGASRCMSSGQDRNAERRAGSLPVPAVLQGE
jgi:hypothetical protein